MSKEIDDKLFEMLNILPIGSKLRTSLNIRLADYSSQLIGYRSTRHVRGDDRKLVEENFLELSNLLYFIVNECLDKLKIEHTYKDYISSLDDLSLEILLENTLYDCVVRNDLSIFDDIFLLK